MSEIRKYKINAINVGALLAFPTVEDGIIETDMNIELHLGMYEFLLGVEDCPIIPQKEVKLLSNCKSALETGLLKKDLFMEAYKIFLKHIVGRNVHLYKRYKGTQIIIPRLNIPNELRVQMNSYRVSEDVVISPKMRYSILTLLGEIINLSDLSIMNEALSNRDKQILIDLCNKDSFRPYYYKD